LDAECPPSTGCCILGCVQVHIDYDELEDAFSAAAPATPPRIRRASLRPRSGGDNIGSVLSIDRSRVVGVLMRTLKLDAAGVDAAVGRMLMEGSEQGVVLEDNEIDGILSALPSDAEVAQIKAISCVSALKAGIRRVNKIVIVQHPDCVALLGAQDRIVV
jgi:hypothetical protein